MGSSGAISTIALLAASSLALPACIDGGKDGTQVSTPAFVARNVKAYGETAVGLPPEVTYGWQVGVAGDVLTWRECPAVDRCGRGERTRAASDLIAIERVGEVEIDGERVDVVKLSLAPRKTYIVPSVKVPPR